MMDEWIRMKQCMEDSGCSAAAITRAKNFYQAGAVDDLIRFLRSCRCEALEEIHEKQKKLDQLEETSAEMNDPQGMQLKLF